MQTTPNRHSAKIVLANATLVSMSAMGNARPAKQEMELGKLGQRETVTPASLLRDNKMHVVFDGNAR